MTDESNAPTRMTLSDFKVLRTDDGEVLSVTANAWGDECRPDRGVRYLREDLDPEAKERDSAFSEGFEAALREAERFARKQNRAWAAQCILSDIANLRLRRKTAGGE